MRMDRRIARKIFRSVLLGCVCITGLWAPLVQAESGTPHSTQPEFSGTLLKQIDGKKHHAQVFGKGDRLRVEYKYALRTEVGFSAIEIVRFDQAEVWRLHPQQKIALVIPLMDDILPLSPELAGETSRTFVGADMVAGRASQVFDVQVSRHGRAEHFTEWIDDEMGIVLKLVNRDHNWNMEYERIRASPQPGYYFDVPPGYQKQMSASRREREG